MVYHRCLCLSHRSRPAAVKCGDGPQGIPLWATDRSCISKGFVLEEEGEWRLHSSPFLPKHELAAMKSTFPESKEPLGKKTRCAIQGNECYLLNENSLMFVSQMV